MHFWEDGGGMINGCKVIDFHGHVGSWDHIGMIDDADTMLRTMDAVGVDTACLFNIFDADSRVSNDRTITFTSRHPDRFIPFAYIWPEGGADTMVAEAKRSIDELGCKAFKTYPPHTTFTLADRRWDPLYEFVQERGLTLITHTSSEWQSYPKYLGEVASRFPGANFVAGHSGNVLEYRNQAIEAARAYPNFYLETCSTFRTPGVIEQLVREGGADRVLFGSDLPLMDPRSQIGKVITADLSDEDKRRVLGENAKRLLGL